MAIRRWSNRFHGHGSTDGDNRQALRESGGNRGAIQEPGARRNEGKLSLGEM